MAVRRSPSVLSSFRSPICLFLPRLAGVTRVLCLLFGANTPWNRVRLILGFGTSEASAIHGSDDPLTPPALNIKYSSASISPKAKGKGPLPAQ
jgi:hypothetical protein